MYVRSEGAMTHPRGFAVCGAVSSAAFATLLLVSVIFTQSPDATALLSSGAAAGSSDQHNFFATVAPGGSLHKLPAAAGNGALAQAEKKLSSFAYPRFPAFARSPKAGPRAPKMTLTDIENTLQTDAADLLKDAGPAHAAVSINTPRAQFSPPPAALATPSTFAVGSPFPAKGARVIYIGGGDAPSQPSLQVQHQQPSYSQQSAHALQQQQQQQQPAYGQQSMVYVGGNAASQSNQPADPQLPVAQQAAAGYGSQLPMSPAYSQRLDVNNPNAPDMQQWRPAYRQPPLGDVDHGESIGQNDEDQDNTRFARGYRRPSMLQEFRRMEAREHADRQMIRRLRGALQRVQEMSARAYTGAQAADVVLGSAAIRLRGAAAE